MVNIICSKIKIQIGGKMTKNELKHIYTEMRQDDSMVYFDVVFRDKEGIEWLYHGARAKTDLKRLK